MNWIADAYSSTEEIKANGQVIVGLLHEDVGHLGIFVSGRVAKKEHAQIVEVLKHIESLRPGLYVMEIQEVQESNGKVEYEVTFEERRLEDLRRLNKLERRDEKPFEVVGDVSALSDKLYTLFVRPFIRPFVNDKTAELGRVFHPLRMQRWAMSDLNPWLWAVPALASSVKANRQAAPPDNSCRRAENAVSEVFTAGLNLYRDLRDATMEALFFQIYGPPAALRATKKTAAETEPTSAARELPIVKQALDSIGTGGYPEAMALMGALIGRGAGRIPLARLELVDEFIRSDRVLSRLPADVIRHIKAEQAVVAELEPERGLQSLPKLLANSADRRRALAGLEKAIEAVPPTRDQKVILERVRNVLGASPGNGAVKSNRGREEGKSRDRLHPHKLSRASRRI